MFHEFMSSRVRIWIHWQIEWSGFAGVIGSDVICLHLWYCCFAS